MNEILKNFLNNIDFMKDNYKINNGVLYYKKINYLPVARIIDDIIYINFDISVKKQYFVLIKYCLKNNIRENRIRFVSDIFPEKKHIDWDDYHYNNINSMLELYSNSEIFYIFKKINFDFIKSLSVYLYEMDLVSYFIEFCNKYLIKRYTGKERKFSHYYSNIVKEDWIIEDNEIRNSLTNIVRKIKIKIMLNNE